MAIIILWLNVFCITYWNATIVIFQFYGVCITKLLFRILPRAKCDWHIAHTSTKSCCNVGRSFAATLAAVKLLNETNLIVLGNYIISRSRFYPQCERRSQSGNGSKMHFRALIACRSTLINARKWLNHNQLQWIQEVHWAVANCVLLAWLQVRGVADECTLISSDFKCHCNATIFVAI